MRILHLTLRKEWFDMIASGEKKEEYREIKRFWIQHLCNEVEYENGGAWEGVFKKFDAVKFKHEYAKDAKSITLICNGISIGPAKPEWSDNWQGDVFVIKLGEIIK